LEAAVALHQAHLRLLQLASLAVLHHPRQVVLLEALPNHLQYLGVEAARPAQHLEDCSVRAARRRPLRLLPSLLRRPLLVGCSPRLASHFSATPRQTLSRHLALQLPHQPPDRRHLPSRCSPYPLQLQLVLLPPIRQKLQREVSLAAAPRPRHRSLHPLVHNLQQQPAVYSEELRNQNQHLRLVG
jgi:hypothetical protein